MSRPNAHRSCAAPVTQSKAGCAQPAFAAVIR